MNKLKEFDKNCKRQRSELISNNYKEIVGEIHDYFQLKIINSFEDLIVLEIVKFDYMTNLHSDGDKLLWIDFVDSDSNLHHLKVVINLLSEDYIEFNNSKKLLSTTSLTQETLDKFSKMCLGVFRRGYDKI